MRTVLVAIVGMSMTILLAPVAVVARLFGVEERAGSIYERCMRLWARSLDVAAGVHIRLHGTEHIPAGEGAVYMSNHVSWFDIFPLAAELPRYTFIAKAELRRIPMFGWGAAAAGIVFLDRGNRKAAFESYKTAAKEVQRGRSIVVYPEGTRGYDYHLRPFKKGPFVLAIASQSLIVPTIAYGAREVMRKGSFRIRPGTVHIHFLEPIPTVGYDYERRTELMTLVWNRMADAMRELYGVGTAEQPVAPERTAAAD